MSAGMASSDAVAAAAAAAAAATGGERDEMLELQAEQMAESALAALPESARAAKFDAVKQGILKRLRSEPPAKPSAANAGREPAAKKPRAAAAPPPPKPRRAEAGAQARKLTAEAEGEAEAPADKVVLPLATVRACDAALSAAHAGESFAEAAGDVPWFADAAVIRRLCEASAAAHADQKLLVAAPAEEIRRICPGGDRVLGAGAVLRLGGAHHGGYGEADVGYAYRQLSRALHPDKNPGIAEAPDSFRRLSEAAEELKRGLADSRQLLGKLRTGLGMTVSEIPATGVLERPQAALIAEASRVLSAVLALTGEGRPVSEAARARALEVFAQRPHFADCHARHLLSRWFDGEELLDHFGSAMLRSAYDCLPKRFRAQFLCLLNRAAAAEAARNDSCVRASWQAVLAQFPEMGLWRDFLDRLRRRVWVEEVTEERGEGRASRPSKWDQQEDSLDGKPSSWAKAWRAIIQDVLPRDGGSTAQVDDRELCLLGEALWRDVSEWATGAGVARHLDLFSAEFPLSDQGCRWVFVPVVDLLLAVGEDLVGVSSSGIFAEAPAKRPRLPFAAALRRARRGTYKRGLALPAPSQQQVRESKLSKGPTRVVLLTNLVGPGEVDDDLQEETAEEAAKYGKLKKCIVTEAVGAPEHEAVRIFLEFQRVEGASKAYTDMNGRYFGGRRVKARFYDEERYEKGDFERRAPTRFLQLLNLVGLEDLDPELERETAEEAAKFGEVKACIARGAPDASAEEAVQVFIEFGSMEVASKAHAAWRGRLLGGRELRVRFVESLAVAQGLTLPAWPRDEVGGSGGAAAVDGDVQAPSPQVEGCAASAQADAGSSAPLPGEGAAAAGAAATPVASDAVVPGPPGGQEERREAKADMWL